jgi:hypothetical protein
MRQRSSCAANRSSLKIIPRILSSSPSTIQKLIWPSRRANAFRNLVDGEAAQLEEAQQQAKHEEWPRGIEDEDRCSGIHLPVWSCR